MLTLTLLKFILKSQVKTYSSIMKYLYHIQKFYRCHPIGTVMDKQKISPRIWSHESIQAYYRSLGKNRNHTSLKSTLFSLHLFCFLLLFIWDPPALMGPTGDFRYPFRLVFKIQPSIGKGSALQPRPWPLLCLFSREASGLSEVSTISLFNCCVNILTSLPTSSLNFPSNLFSILQAECHSEMQV